MIQLEMIRGYFPEEIRNNRMFDRYMLKEYLQLLILDYLSNTHWMNKMTFIGGTNLRLVKGLDRFSEDLDFDCKDLRLDEFIQVTDSVLQMLHRNGIKSEIRDKDSSGLTAFRRNFHFPQLLFDLGLTGHKAERLLVKIEAQDQGVTYAPTIVKIKGCGLFFPISVPPDAVLCSMKIAAMLNRTKGRDLYDVMFLLGLTAPDYDFLARRCGINTSEELKMAIASVLKKTDLNHKMKDFEHLLIHPDNSKKILRFESFIEGYL